MKRPWSRAMAARMAQLAFELADGDVEEQRFPCDRCDVPVARVKPLRGRRAVKNFDGSLHAKSCAHTHLRRYRSLKQGLDAPTADMITMPRASHRTSMKGTLGRLTRNGSTGSMGTTSCRWCRSCSQ